MNDSKLPENFPTPDAGNSQTSRPNAYAVSTYVDPMGYAGIQEDDDEIDLREYWHVILKRKWTVISLFAMVVIVALISTLLTTPIYRATTVIQIERENVKVLDFKDVQENDSGSYDFYQTQYELLKSKALAARVVDQLGLANIQQAKPAKDESLFSWFSKLRDNPEVKSQNTVAAVNSEEDARLAQAGALLGGLTVEPVRGSRLVRISYDSPQAEMTAAVANAVANNFINVNMERRFDATAYAKTFLEERIAQVKTRLEKAEKSMLEYARDNEIYNVGKDGGTTASQNVEDFNIALNAAQQERIKAESLYLQLMSGHGGELPQVLESSIIQSLRENKVKLESEYQDKLNTFKPSYPAMQELAARIEQVEAQLNKERQVVSNSIKASYQAAKAHEELIRDRFSASKRDMVDLQARGIEYSILKREADTNRELYDGLLQRLKEVGVAGGVGTNNISVVDKAEVPKSPFKPNLSKNLLIAMIIGLLGGIGLAFLFEHLDDTFKRSADVENELNLPVLGLIPVAPELESGGGILGVSVDNPRSAIVEAYRSVRTALQFASEHGAPQLLALTSSEKGEAKTTSAVGIGTQFAQFGSKVLIIDCDLRNPSLHKAFGVDNHHGLTNVLAGGESPMNVTQNSAVANLYFMPSGPLPPNPSELLSSNKMKQLLELARTKFDYIIIDSPPILGLADVLVIANMADALILQIHAGATRRATVQAALKRLLAIRVKPLGCMLTRMRGGVHGYGYNYDYYYSYGSEHDAKAVKVASKA